VDLENHHYRSFQGFTCLMQLSTRTEDFLIDLLALRSHVRDALGPLFLDAAVLKVRLSGLLDGDTQRSHDDALCAGSLDLWCRHMPVGQP
jgi:hypothetical protein